MPIQTNISSLDLQYYTQCLGCSIGSLGYTVANDLYYGRKNTTSNLRNLELMIGYMDIVERYKPLGVETVASTTITVYPTITIGINLGNITFDGPGGLHIVTPNTGNPTTTAKNLQTSLGISNQVSIVTVESLGDPSLPTTPVNIIFQAAPGLGLSGNNLQVRLTSTTTLGPPPFTFNIIGYTNLQGGAAPLVDGQNSVTEEQLQFTILPILANLGGCVLPPPGQIQYSTPPNISLSNGLLTELGDGIITETSDQILTEP